MADNRKNEKATRGTSGPKPASADVAFSSFPDLDGAYQDEFGAVDTEVYNEARALWPHAERLAADIICDTHLGLELMIRAVARVSAARSSGAQILNLRFYLLRSYKNLLLAELEKENGRQRLLRDRFAERTLSPSDTEDAINKKILINELRLEMDDWMREVFDLLVLGYAFEELVPRYGSASNVIRSKFSKKLARFTKKITSRLQTPR